MDRSLKKDDDTWTYFASDIAYHANKIDRNFDVLDGLIAFAEARDHTVLDLAFSWLLANKSVSSVIAGATKIEQVITNSKAAAWDLTTEEVDEANGILGAN